MHIPYYDCCGNCTSYDGEYCDVYKQYCEPGDTCRYQENRITYEDSENGPCYITTVVCDLLKYNDDCEVMQILRWFRNNVLQKDEKYKKILFDYDTIGPKIAKGLYNGFAGSVDMEMIENLYEYSLKPICLLIEDKKYDEAVSKYIRMTNILATFCGIPKEDTISEDYDYTKGGHGKVKIKNEEE